MLTNAMPGTQTIVLACLSALLGACASTLPSPDAASSPHVDVPAIDHPAGETASWWFRSGATEAAGHGAMAGNARNVILFIGDGMSLTTVTAARILDGQQKGGPGEGNRLSWEEYPATALSRTYNTDSQTPDSAGTMTAMVTGAKTRKGVIGIGQQSFRYDCAGARRAPLLSLWELAAASGMATGVVTTARVTHATPAATFAHSADRDWENDAELTPETRAAGCIDIGRQMVESPFGTGLDVLLGGGRSQFMPAQQRDPEYDDKVGLRLDGRDLIDEWKQRHPDGRYVWNASQFASAPAGTPLLGLFEPDHMQFEHDRPGDPAGEPSLAQMTRAAISRLSSNHSGYVLLVEGGRIDMAHHDGNAYRALTDTIALSEAVRTANEMTSADDTLILVTADHSHTLGFVGYPVRGNPILGKVHDLDRDGQPRLARDALGLPYTTLVYANGPGYVGGSARQPEGPKRFLHTPNDYRAARQGRPDLTHVETTSPDYLQESLVPLPAESHGGGDVGIWARGPGSQAVRGSLEQNVIFHLMLQSVPRLRSAVCARGDCNADGVPVTLPQPDGFKTTR